MIGKIVCRKIDERKFNAKKRKRGEKYSSNQTTSFCASFDSHRKVKLSENKLLLVVNFFSRLFRFLGVFFHFAFYVVAVVYFSVCICFFFSLLSHLDIHVRAV